MLLGILPLLKAGPKGKFLGDHCFIASEWTTVGAGPVILLEHYSAEKSRLVEEKFSSPLLRSSGTCRE